MKHYLITWDVRDGENEYSEEQILNTEKHILLVEDEEKAFEWLLKEFYLVDKDEVKKLEYGYEIGSDYRIHKFSSIQEITQDQYKVLKDLGIVYDIDYK